VYTVPNEFALIIQVFMTVCVFVVVTDMSSTVVVLRVFWYALLPSVCMCVQTLCSQLRAVMCKILLKSILKIQNKII